MFNFFKKKPSSYLGIDIGTSSVKMVQLKLEENKARLETYGFWDNYGNFEILENSAKMGKIKILDEKIVGVIKNIIKEAGAITKETVMSVPVFSTFSSVIEFPEMTEAEVAKAVPFEARQYIPVPLEDVIMDWSIVGKKLRKESNGSGNSAHFSLQVMLVAIPKEIALKYARIAELAGLKLNALEAESFALARSLIGNDKMAVIIIDIGSRHTNISIIDKGYAMANRGLDIGGNELTRAVSQGINIDFDRAESLKKEVGLRQVDAEREISRLMFPAIDIISNETFRMMNAYLHKNNRRVEEVIITGGGSCLAGLDGYLAKNLGIKVLTGNPWARIIYPSELEMPLKEIAPFFSVAAGLAMREL